jgi:hypothetical protein
MPEPLKLRVAVEGCVSRYSPVILFLPHLALADHDADFSDQGHGTLHSIYASVEESCRVKGWDGVDVLIIGGDFQVILACKPSMLPDLTLSRPSEINMTSTSPRCHPSIAQWPTFMNTTVGREKLLT